MSKTSPMVAILEVMSRDRQTPIEVGGVLMGVQTQPDTAFGGLCPPRQVYRPVSGLSRGRTVQSRRPWDGPSWRRWTDRIIRWSRAPRRRRKRPACPINRWQQCVDEFGWQRPGRSINRWRRCVDRFGKHYAKCRRQMSVEGGDARRRPTV